MKSIKESYPEDYNNKLERNYEMMEEKITKLKKEVKSLKWENLRLKDQYTGLEFVNKKISHALGKANVKMEK